MNVLDRMNIICSSILGTSAWIDHNECIRLKTINPEVICIQTDDSDTEESINAKLSEVYLLYVEYLHNVATHVRAVVEENFDYIINYCEPNEENGSISLSLQREGVPNAVNENFCVNHTFSASIISEVALNTEYLKNMLTIDEVSEDVQKAQIFVTPEQYEEILRINGIPTEKKGNTLVETLKSIRKRKS